MSGNWGWWKYHKQEDWVEADWADWEKRGRPRVPVGNRLSAKPPPKPLDLPPRVDPPGGLFGGFDLRASGRPKGQSARSASIDRLLDKLGVKSKR
jgi:hypothetical protein